MTHSFPNGEARAIQVNFCKNPLCQNYGVPASLRKFARRVTAIPVLPGADYTISGAGAGFPVLLCRLCGESLPMKSNQGISEEIDRISGYLKLPQPPSCPNASCEHHAVPLGGEDGAYYAYGKTSQGSQRYRCRSCGKTFSISHRSTLRQRLPHKNLQVFRLLMNKMPVARMHEVTGLSFQTIYDKIDFIHRQCMRFALKHERKLLDGMAIQRLYVAVDRQDYVVNWARRKDKRNITLRALGSADLGTGYVFGMNLNFDPALSPAMIEPQAQSLGDYDVAYPFRRYARFWLEPDYDKAVTETQLRLSKRKKRSLASLESDIAGAYDDADARMDVESSEMMTIADAWPRQGMQVRNEYTMYAHFYHLQQLFRGVEKVRFFMDQESGIRAACLAAFEREIKERRCDAFYVRLSKELTVDQKRQMITARRATFRAMQDAHPGLTASEIQVLMMRAEMAKSAALGRWSDRWCMHPMPNNSEPEKAICWLTDIDERPTDPAELDAFEAHAANLHLKGSLHAIDRFFMQVRRRLSLLERPIGTASKAGRIWHGYSAYQPENIEKVLDIFRVFYNYCLAGEDGQTPAMRLGLADRVVAMQDMLSTVLHTRQHRYNANINIAL